MTGLIKQWVMTLSCTALVCAAAMALIPPGRVKKAARLVCGLALALALISPLQEPDMSSYSLELSRYRALLEEKEQAVSQTNSRLERAIIEEECAAYILDKAQVLGLDAESVTVGVKWGDEQQLWYPYEAKLDIRGDSDAAARLSRVIESELGIPAERQDWNSDEKH